MPNAHGKLISQTKKYVPSIILFVSIFFAIANVKLGKKAVEIVPHKRTGKFTSGLIIPVAIPKSEVALDWFMPTFTNKFTTKKVSTHDDNGKINDAKVIGKKPLKILCKHL